VSTARRPPERDDGMYAVLIPVAFLIAYGLAQIARAVTGIR
jgi:hypothetical protein